MLAYLCCISFDEVTRRSGLFEEGVHIIARWLGGECLVTLIY